MKPIIRILPLISALLIAPLFAHAEDRVFYASKARTPVEIDGKIDKVWENTKSASLDHYRRDEKSSDRQKSKFRMMWDEENLYVLFQCQDKYITAREIRRDGQPYFDDCAEIFLIPADAPLNMHYGFELNLYKASNDFIFLNKFHEARHALIKSYDPDFDVEVSIDGTLNDNSDEDREWIMEMAIPLKLFEGINNFSPVASGNRWVFQAIRQDRNDATGNRRSWSTLFEVHPDHPNVHEPEDFGYLEFVD